MAEPIGTRPHMPGYGTLDDYWVATTRPDGRPLLSPNPISPVRRLAGPFRPLAADAFFAPLVAACVEQLTSAQSRAKVLAPRAFVAGGGRSDRPIGNGKLRDPPSRATRSTAPSGQAGRATPPYRRTARAA